MCVCGVRGGACRVAPTNASCMPVYGYWPCHLRLGCDAGGVGGRVVESDPLPTMPQSLTEGERILSLWQQRPRCQNGHNEKKRVCGRGEREGGGGEGGVGRGGGGRW